MIIFDYIKTRDDESQDQEEAATTEWFIYMECCKKLRNALAKLTAST